MIGAPGLLSLHLYLYIFIVAVVIMVFLGIFIPHLYKRLSIRITALIFLSGPATVLITRVLNDLFLGAQLPIRFHLFEMILIVLGGPVALGVLAALFVRRPLHQFDEAIDAVEQSDYKVQLRTTGIHEFDEIFAKFNKLIKRLRQEEKLRKDLVSDTSHELNTPLTILIGQLTAIQEGKYKMTKERVALLKEQAVRLEELIGQLDAYTKARLPDRRVSEEIHLLHLCKELVMRYNIKLKQKGITVDLDIAEDYTLHGNRSALEQILANFMQNTLRYSEATAITISVSSHKFSFSDNGRGVPPESLPYLFERFYRVDASRSRATGGLGLGLAIVRELVESQGWTIAAAAGHPGLTFVITLSK